MIAALLDKLPNLKVIARRGVGFDNVDVTAAEQRGIRVTRTVGAVEEAVAELPWRLCWILLGWYPCTRP